jgi:hypothetical protein
MGEPNQKSLRVLLDIKNPVKNEMRLVSSSDFQSFTDYQKSRIIKIKPSMIVEGKRSDSESYKSERLLVELVMKQLKSSKFSQSTRGPTILQCPQNNQTSNFWPTENSDLTAARSCLSTLTKNCSDVTNLEIRDEVIRQKRSLNYFIKGKQ